MMTILLIIAIIGWLFNIYGLLVILKVFKWRDIKKYFFDKTDTESIQALTLLFIPLSIVLFLIPFVFYGAIIWLIKI